MKPYVALPLAGILALGNFACAQQSPVAVAAVPAATSASIPTSSSKIGPDANGRYTLREGEDVQLKFAQDISSKTAVDGDPVAFILQDDLKVGEVLVAKAGSKAFGEVTNAKKSGMMGKAGELNVRLDYLKVTDGKIRLRGTKSKEGESGTTGAVVLTVLFGPIGLIKHGKNIDIKEGTALKAFVADDVALPPITATN
jgi:hypothetical protein